jgi:hypothetical protein
LSGRRVEGFSIPNKIIMSSLSTSALNGKLTLGKAKQGAKEIERGGLGTVGRWWRVEEIGKC